MARHPSPSSPHEAKGLKALFWTWFATASGTLATLLIEPTGEGQQYGLNRAIPFLALLALSVLIALVLGGKTLLRRKHLTKRTQCLCLLPLLAVFLAVIMLLDYLVNNRWTFNRVMEPEANEEAVEEGALESLE